MPGILLATHGGHGADGAARLAVLLARRLGAELSVVTLLEPLPVYDGGFAPPYVRTGEEEARDARALLADARAQLERAGAPEVTPHLRHGGAAVSIAAVAREQRADLVVLGQGPHRVLDRALGGETALELVQMASTPILIVPADATALPRRMLAAVDFTPTSTLAAETVAAWARDGDVVELAHVHGRYEGFGEMDSKLREAARSLTPAPGAQLEPVELEGDPAQALLARLEETRADLIALGSHGYGLWKRLTLGSVASKVIRVSTRPVLVVPLGALAQAA